MEKKPYDMWQPANDQYVKDIKLDLVRLHRIYCRIVGKRHLHIVPVPKQQQEETK